MVITILIPVILIAVVLIIASGIRGSEQGGEDMIKNVYVYLVLFATLMMIIGGSVASFMAIADIVAPAPYFQSYEEYKQWGMEKPNPESGQPQTQLTEEEMRQKYEMMVRTETERQVERAKNTLIKSLGWIVIPLPVFMFYQRKLSRNREAE
ncbi:hypothetical protein BHU72_04480 [Desulfuribacillus stibiiarsenatis]|uniref:DUF5671 domain-containing protein n=1 Tax=Desulfuribacillus stibiiarsenatis TaxID=1390249 RepID=A0A1E5L5E3_9FIRM|nr:hypothetical protein [Desulfuribacillus stibiiarsenatis]OEH85355.1 hypothetical protein BHU72_04480 [Desulfuribacillus stibiiarsenatis]